MKVLNSGFCLVIVLLLSSNAYSTLSPSISSDYYNCATGEYHFMINDLDYTYDNVEWDFGDNSTTIGGANQSHLYALTGQYTVTANLMLNGSVVSSVTPYTFNAIVVNNLSPSFNTINNGDGSFQFDYTGPDFSSVGAYTYSYTFNFGDGNQVMGSALSASQAIEMQHFYYGISGFVDPSLTVSVTYDSATIECSDSDRLEVDFIPDPCCSNFAPIVGERYWVSAWVKEDHVNQVKTYQNTKLEVEFLGGTTSVVSFTSTGDIIEGWQRIVGDFVVPTGTTDLQLHMVNESSSIAAYFDDVRVHPFNASMKSYVYDPETLWLTAELDDNNYATFYEYDKEGQLIRIKKETSRGIMTIQESRSSNPKEENE